MARKVIAIDTETTSLRWDRQMWEIALVWREHDELVNYQAFIDLDDIDLSRADPISLRMNHFHDRHPQAMREFAPVQPTLAHIVTYTYRRTIDATIVGATPNFDTYVLEREMLDHQLQPAWDHRLRCVSTLASGFACREVNGLRDAVECMGLEWDDGQAHTALYDATKALEVYEAIMANHERENA